MPIIRRPRQGDQITVEKGCNLMTALQENNIPVASSCAGDAVCGKCLIEVLHGRENLNSPNAEEKFLLEKDRVPTRFRISCQCRVNGDLEVDAPYW